MLNEVIATHDVADTEMFVQATINRARLVLSSDERDELVAEGLAIMCKLGRDFEPHRDGYAHAGSFAAHASMFLPRKLGDAWHKMHEEHMLRTDAVAGKRRWRYDRPAVSLQQVLYDDDEERDRPLPGALVVSEVHDDMLARLKAALDERWERRRQTILQVGELLGRGSEPRDVADELGLSLAQVRAAMSEIAQVAARLKEAT